MQAIGTRTGRIIGKELPFVNIQGRARPLCTPQVAPFSEKAKLGLCLDEAEDLLSLFA